MSDRSRELSVVMQRRALQSRWVDHQWEAIGVAPDASLSAPRQVLQEAGVAQWLYPALTLALHTDEVDNYLLNLSTPDPRLFVVSRMEGELPQPFMLTVSYGEAARMLDAGETVDSIPLPDELHVWALDFSRAHFRPPEPKKEKRYARAPQVVGAST